MAISLFRKILIANRGEIAIRIARTCKKLGIKTVAIYSDPDIDSPFVYFCDEAYPLHGVTSAETYLVIDKIIQIAKKSGADAVHPGFGFLSEKEAFAKALQKEKIAFIGPSPESINLMGDKVTARNTMKKAGVPIVPGSAGAITNIEDAKKLAKEIGYPVLLKASSGGGGKGMRKVEVEKDLESSFNSASSEALKAFGDGAVYMEKYIVNPHHIEVQVMGDGKGGARHFYERECSIQRRHQKVLEEAPSPYLIGHDNVRKKLFDVSLQAVSSMKYSGAGTLEFIMGEDRNFYFMEMNTRIQVEHPVTEWITGFDLIEEQIKIAAGHPFGYAQDQIEQRGHAVECRIYAEDPITYLPNPGYVKFIQNPEGPFVRIDGNVQSESPIPIQYDPMISKMSTWGRNREEAIARMRVALQELNIVGTTHNISLHQSILEDKGFLSGITTTGFLDKFKAKLPEPTSEILSLGASFVTQNLQVEKINSHELSAWQHD